MRVSATNGVGCNDIYTYAFKIAIIIISKHLIVTFFGYIYLTTHFLLTVKQ